MKQIDGKARRVLKDSKPLAAVMLAVSIAAMAFIFWNRGQVSSGTLFGVTAVFAAALGGNLMILLRDIR